MVLLSYIIWWVKLYSFTDYTDIAEDDCDVQAAANKQYT